VVGELLLRDISRAGHELGRRTVTDLPGRVTLRAVLERAIRDEVETYNADPGPVYVGLVQPVDAVRYSDGHRMRRPRPLDADRFVLAAEQAVAAGLLRLRIGGIETDDLGTELVVDEVDEVVAVLERPVVVGDA
jgi:hypothetical protein